MAAQNKVNNYFNRSWKRLRSALKRITKTRPSTRRNKGKDRQFSLYRLRFVEIGLVAMASASGIYFAYRQVEINRDMSQIQKTQLDLQVTQVELQQTIEHQHRQELIAKYMGALETGTLSEQLGAAYALSKIEGDEPIGAFSRGLLSDFDPVGETVRAHILQSARPQVDFEEIDSYVRRCHLAGCVHAGLG